MRSLLRLYPRWWQERYGTEFLALLEDTPQSTRVAWEMIRAAFVAHAAGAPGRSRRSGLVKGAAWTVTGALCLGQFLPETRSIAVVMIRALLVPFGFSTAFIGLWALATRRRLPLFIRRLPSFGAWSNQLPDQRGLRVARGLQYLSLGLLELIYAAYGSEVSGQFGPIFVFWMSLMATTIAAAVVAAVRPPVDHPDSG